MIWVFSIGGGLIALVGVLLVWGFLHLCQSRSQALAEIRRIELKHIEPLADECVQVFRQKLGVRLDPNDCGDAAQKLDNAFRDRPRLKAAFELDGFYWYFVKPTGSFLGELLRRHAGHQWRKQSGEAPTMRVALKDGESEVFPFDKVIKHAQVGDPGDLVAFVALARTFNRAAKSSGAEQPES